MNLDLAQCNSPETAAAIEAVTKSRNKSSPSRSGARTASSTAAEDEEKQIYKRRLASALLGKEDDSNHKILKFTKDKPAVAPPDSFKSTLHARFSHNKVAVVPASAAKKLNRHVPSAPIKVLDAPELMNDYYLNLLDWSSGNQVAIGLERNVYVWSADSGTVSSLLECPADTYISSVKWSGDGAYVGVGLGTGEVQIWDVEEQTKLRSMFGHETHVFNSWLFGA